ncbi:chromate resistance protein ChrB domain-containing protein [Mycobacterium sp. pUA109]|uniref:chromate resistance protein ChrB domain-containing protein n=1 Tax=Mycobacterium sp. pUA109 TaxID=3238982 RepID=UPI00351BA2E4
MKWVTRENVHLDRVASPWLIKRFIDPDAEFVFIDPDAAPWPTDAIPFALPGAELGMHDSDGTTFDKILRKYQLDTPELLEMADVIRAAVRHVLGEDQQGSSAWAIHDGITLSMISEGTMLRRNGDHVILDASMELYDSLFAFFWARSVDPRVGKETFWERMESLRAQWRRDQPLAPSTYEAAM